MLKMIDLRIPRTGQYHKIVIIRIVSFHLKQVLGHRSAQSTTSNSFVIESFEKLSASFPKLLQMVARAWEI